MNHLLKYPPSAELATAIAPPRLPPSATDADVGPASRLRI